MSTSTQTHTNISTAELKNRVSALMGLKATLPRIFTQISLRMWVVTGQRKPEAIKASAMLRERGERVPSGSPSEMRLSSVCRTTPGSMISVEK